MLKSNLFGQEQGQKQRKLCSTLIKVVKEDAPNVALVENLFFEKKFKFAVLSELLEEKRKRNGKTHTLDFVNKKLESMKKAKRMLEEVATEEPNSQYFKLAKEVANQIAVVLATHTAKKKPLEEQTQH